MNIIVDNISRTFIGRFYRYTQPYSSSFTCLALLLGDEPVVPFEEVYGICFKEVGYPRDI